MRGSFRPARACLVTALAAALAVSACRTGPPTPTLSPTPTPLTPTPPPSAAYSPPDLRYRLIAAFPNVFYCDPDYYPVGRPGQEEKNALEQFPTIRADAAEFQAILQYLRLSAKPEYTDDEKLQVYREHKKLGLAVQLTATGEVYGFALRVGEGRGERIEGTITKSGDIRISKREPSFNTCPICLAEGTIIDTPDGPVPVERLRRGMSVWTLDGSGKRVAAVVLDTVQTPVPPSFRVLKVTLDDGRTVTASPGHPAADGRTLGEYRAGDILDGSPVARAEYIAYSAGSTYDILPSGPTGLYRANGILLRSTLADGHRR